MKNNCTRPVGPAPLIAVLAIFSSIFAAAQAPVFTKVQVGERIRQVENGVDEFRKHLDNRTENAKSSAQAAQSSGRTKRRGGADASTSDARKDQAKNTKDDLDDALSDLNRSTNRLRRKFDPMDKWMETRSQMEHVMDSARRVNQTMVRGKYGTQLERYWAVLRGSINDLARCYGITPMGV
jgi:Skp family chaperone for outer membrane proteins